MIVIPDIHGRSFWKIAVTKAQPDEKIIFLGDYLDHYEGRVDAVNGNIITQDIALQNFKEILRFKNENPDKVVMLLGNHDTSYFLDTTPCRQYKNLCSTIAELFNNNRGLFRLGYYCTIGGRKFSFSHSYILEQWAKSVAELSKCATPQEVIDQIGKMDDQRLSLALNHIGPARNGNHAHGSMIWADLGEALDHLHDNWIGSETFQVFGHTQSPNIPVICVNFAMLDCHCAFRIKEDCKSGIMPEWFEKI